MKAVLMSIQPKWCKLIVRGEKTIEIRKSKPKLETPFKVYIYCTKNYSLGEYYTSQDLFAMPAQGKVIGEFVCDKIIELAPINRAEEGMEKQACLNREQIVNYLRRKGFGWHISNLKIYDKPKELSEFFVYCDRCDKRPIACKFAYEESNENGYYSECMCDFKRPIERPPQSWCYVESEE